ncbi:hypothetical protein [Desertivirga arenae]|uniref:hypothetical protein n=1 Tax=Desertivirga arenae TaxID=2810309 RepID=UPI001A977E45|nr:hypothetical protein [Pedobacter sp. SYSU D00823]
MKPSRFKTLLLGLLAGLAYAFLIMALVTELHKNVSITFIFAMPLTLGAIPVLLSTKEQLDTYRIYLLLPWGVTLTLFLLSFASGFEGIICLVIIIGPFLVLGSLGAFIFRIIKLKSNAKQTPLYSSLLLPLLILTVESYFPAKDQYYKVVTIIEVNASTSEVWNNIKNVRNIKSAELSTHFVHLIGIPKPLNGELNKEGLGGIRSITWEKGIKFQEVIKSWSNGNSFTYDINVDPNSIPPKTLDDHVMIGGRYFDVVEGGYALKNLSENKCLVTLSCKYRVTTNLGIYSKWWADFILNDFNETILEVIKKRSENDHLQATERELQKIRGISYNFNQVFEKDKKELSIEHNHHNAKQLKQFEQFKNLDLKPFKFSILKHGNTTRKRWVRKIDGDLREINLVEVLVPVDTAERITDIETGKVAEVIPVKGTFKFKAYLFKKRSSPGDYYYLTENSQGLIETRIGKARDTVMYESVGVGVYTVLDHVEREIEKIMAER